MDIVYKIFQYVNSVSRLCLHLRDAALELNLPFDMCRWLVRGRRGRPQGTGQASPAFDQQAFVEAVGIAVAAITQTCTIVSQGRSNDLQRLEAHHPPMVREGVDSRVRRTTTTEGEVDVMRGIQDMGAGTKRKRDGREINLLQVRERSRRLRVIKGSKAPVIWARDKLGLRDGHDRCYVSTANSPDL